MFSLDLRKEKRRWIRNCDEEDGSFIENWNIVKAEILQQRYELVREQSIVGGGSIGNKGGRVCASNLTGPTQSIEPLNRQWSSSSN
jgi:hypothetical protein